MQLVTFYWLLVLISDAGSKAHYVLLLFPFYIFVLSRHTLQRKTDVYVNIEYLALIDLY